MARIFAWLRYVSSSIRSSVLSDFVDDNKRCKSCLSDICFVAILLKIKSRSSDENDIVSNIEINSSRRPCDVANERTKSSRWREDCDPVDVDNNGLMEVFPPVNGESKKKKFYA